jgi:hypothetical protein
VGEFVWIGKRSGHAGMSTHEHPLENLATQCSARPLVWKFAEGRRQCAPANSIGIDRMTTRAISLSKSLTFDRVLRRRVAGKEDRERRGQKPDPDKAFQGRFPSIAMLQHSATCGGRGWYRRGNLFTLNSAARQVERAKVDLALEQVTSDRRCLKEPRRQALRHRTERRTQEQRQRHDNSCEWNLREAPIKMKRSRP